MQNRKLVLAQLHPNYYSTNAVCAYIYYGSNDKPMDHEGNEIGMFLDENRRTALENHIQKSILPIIKNGLCNSIYKATEVDYLNMAPHPFIEIIRRDKKVISENELADIQNLLTKTINNHNNNPRNTHKKTKLSIFDQTPLTNQEKNDKHHSPTYKH